jgi:hypothetical protein
LVEIAIVPQLHIDFLSELTQSPLTLQVDDTDAEVFSEVQHLPRVEWILAGMSGRDEEDTDPDGVGIGGGHD